MLTIRNSQLEVFRRQRTEDFIKRVSKYLMEFDPAVDGRRQAEQALDTAARFGFRSEADIAEFARIVCCYLKGFPIGALPQTVIDQLRAHGVAAHQRLHQFEVWARSSGLDA